MKYPIFFLTLALYFSYLILNGTSPLRFLFIWPVVNFILFFAAYVLNKPALIGKRSDGTFHPILLLVNLPWLLLTWSVWALQVSLSREPAFHGVEHASCSLRVGRRPMFALPEVDIIVDLTAEFPARKKVGETHRTIFIPLLDAMHPADCCDLSALDSIAADQRVLIHCAQGHGRTAMVAGLLLHRWGLAASPVDGAEMVRRARPGARMGKSQQEYLRRRAI